MLNNNDILASLKKTINMSLVIKNLSKTYTNKVKALDNLSLEIGQGMFGLLGPNGAGKSTLMRTIATLQSPDTGSIEFNDIDVIEDKISLRKTLGYLPQSFGVYPNMSAEKLLNYFAKLKGISNKEERKKLIDELLDITNLTDVKKKYVSGYSGGMKQRFGIAQLLLNNPQLIIVDDVKELCNDMAILNGGRILKHIKPQDSTKEIKNKIWTKSVSRENLEDAEKEFNILSSNYNIDNSLTIRVFSEKNPGKEFKKADPQLDDVYFIALKEDQNNNS